MKESIVRKGVQQKRKMYQITMTALMTAVVCILAPLSIPIGPVPVSFTAVVLFLSVYLLGWKLGTLSCLAYILLGAAGLPVFSGFSGGIGKLLGPTGGYIIGYIPMTVIAGVCIEHYRSKWVQFSVMVLATAVCYLFGTIWFCMIMDTTAVAALSTCVFPFIPGDLIKIVIAMFGGSILRKRLQQAGVLE